MYNRKEARIQKPRVVLEAQEGLTCSLPSERFRKLLLEQSSGPRWRRGSPRSQLHKSRARYAQNTSIFKK